MATHRPNSIANRSEEELKMQGDRMFKAGRFEEAIKSYSGALSKNPTNYKHLMDRAMCYEKLKKWELFVLDWRRALDIKSNMLYTAGLMLGAGVLHTQDLFETTKYFESARYVARREVENNSKEFSEKLERTRKQRWIDLESKEIDREKQLLHYMTYLLKEEKRNSLCKLMKNKLMLPEEELQAKKQEIKHECADYSKELAKVFDKIRDRRRTRAVPDYLLCPIGYELFRDPVITPTGITYEREAIVNHLNKCGSFDPVTRVPLIATQLIPNRAIMNAVDTFLANNEWARYE